MSRTCDSDIYWFEIFNSFLYLIWLYGCLICLFQRERNSSMSPYQGGNNQSPKMMNGKLNGRQRASSSPTNPSNNHSQSQYYGKKENGIVEKLLNSYGFVECATTGNRVFFHYSEYEGDPNNLIVGGILSHFFKFHYFNWI